MTRSTFDVLAGLRLADGRRWGDAAVAVQVADARAILDDAGARRHWLGRPRGYSKTADVGAILLAELVTGRIPPDTPAYVAASDREQAGLVLDSLAGFVRRSALDVELQAFRAIHRPTGARVEILAADSSGSYGLRPSRLALDELAMWPDTRAARRFHEALWTALPKIPGSVGIVSTTASTPGHWSHAIYRRALDEPDLWRVSETHEPPPWIDPALVEAERRALPESAFARLWENRWTSAEDALVDPGDLDAAAVLDGPLAPVRGRRYVATLDVGLVNDRTVVVVAHAEPVEGGGTRVVCDLLRRWQGSRRRPVDLDDVTETLADLHRRYPGRVVVDPAKAEHLVQRLRKRGLPVSAFSFTVTSVGLLAAALVRALRAHALLLPRDDVLLDELRQVRIVENSAGVPRLDHDRKGHDDQAVALALAVHHLLDRPTGATIHLPEGRWLPGRDNEHPLATVPSDPRDPRNWRPGRPGIAPLGYTGPRRRW